MARVAAAGVLHHVTQRGNRRQKVFFRDADAGGKLCRRPRGGEGLLPDAKHVHLILVPRDGDGLRAALADAHRRYSRAINFRQGCRGYLWQGAVLLFPDGR